jgi:hypothetical protein
METFITNLKTRALLPPHCKPFTHPLPIPKCMLTQALTSHPIQSVPLMFCLKAQTNPALLLILLVTVHCIEMLEASMCSFNKSWPRLKCLALFKRAPGSSAKSVYAPE